MHKKEYITAGRELAADSKVLIMIHGRGGSAEDILTLANHLNVDDYTLVAPQATNFTWYPNSFLAPVASNEPWLTSALNNLAAIVEDLETKGVRKEQIYFLGFSQGACLTLEFVSRNAAKYGGVVAFTGGLIGDKIYDENYRGDFNNTKIFIGTSDPDPHVPVDRVNESTIILKQMNGDVTTKIYKGMGHTISGEEVQEVNKLIFI